MIPCVSIWRDLRAFTHSLIHSFTTSLVKVLEDTTDILARSPAFLCHTASCSQLRLPSNFWLWLLKSPCPLRDSGSWWPTVPSWPLLLNDWPYCGGSIWHTTFLASKGTNSEVQWCSRAPLGPRDRDFPLASHHCLTSSSFLSCLHDPLATSPRNTSLINHMHSYVF